MLAHLLLFGFIYPDRAALIPDRVLTNSWQRSRQQPAAFEAADGSKVCWGTLLSRSQYLFDLREKGYHDARLLPEVGMSTEQIENWTAGIARDGSL